MECFGPTLRRPLIPVCAALLMLPACQREERGPRTDPAAEASAPADIPALIVRYGGDAWQIGEGQRLFRWMNCTGCHGNGGGGMGPSLMDDEWRYGSSMADIVRTIDWGRPNGMPAFHDKLTGQQMWQLAAYVRSLSGLARKDAVPSRADTLAPSVPLTQVRPLDSPPAEAPPQ